MKNNIRGDVLGDSFEALLQQGSAVEPPGMGLRRGENELPNTERRKI